MSWRMMSFALSTWAMGVIVGIVVATREVPAPEVVLPPIHVPAPWGACRIATGPYPWVGEYGQVRDSTWVSLVCPSNTDVRAQQ